MVKYEHVIHFYIRSLSMMISCAVKDGIKDAVESTAKICLTKDNKGWEFDDHAPSLKYFVYSK